DENIDQSTEERGIESFAKNTALEKVASSVKGTTALEQAESSVKKAGVFAKMKGAKAFAKGNPDISKLKSVKVPETEVEKAKPLYSKILETIVISGPF
ncbi:hypothetical protein GN958_ATG06682, partial [Phytophthora infestans]